MPNPRHALHPLSRPLDEAVGYATHICIKCTPASCSEPCGHSAIWMTADLYARLPHCRTIGEFQNKLRCKRCGARGWVKIEAAGR